MRFLVSLLVALLIGAGIGLYLGWVQFPAQVIDSPMPRLEQKYLDDYTVMVAQGYLSDHDLGAALDRLRPLGYDNVPQQIQDTAERYISTSRSIEDIRALVAFAEGVGRLTPIMEPYRLVNSNG